MKKLACLLTLSLTVTAAAQTAPALPANMVRVHYQRPDGNYDGWGLHAWEDTTAKVEWASPLAQTGKDDWGAYWDIPLKPDAQKLGLLVHRGDTKDPGPDMWFDFARGRELFIKSGSANVAYAQAGGKAGPFEVDASKQVSGPMPAPADPPVPAGMARINYFRPDGQYDGWGLHAWEDTTAKVEWASPLAQTGQGSAGVYWDVPLKTDWKKLNFIVHKADEKDPGPDMTLNASQGNQAWVVSGKPEVFVQKPDVNVRTVGNLSQQQAIMLSRDLIAVKPELVQDGALYSLFYSPTAALKLTPEGVQGGDTLTLQEVPAGLSAAQKAKVPYLAGYKLLQVRPEDRARIPEALRGQLALQAAMPDGKLLDVTGVQTAWALDDLYTYTGPLGVTWTNGNPSVRLWAPTAQEVNLLLSREGDSQEMSLPMQRDNQGVWYTNEITVRTKDGLKLTGQSMKGWRYRYQVKVFAPSTGKIETNLVTDPYSVGLTLNSTYSIITDLSDPAQKPQGWDTLKKPALRSISDLSFYELHVRDFSVADTTIPAAERGTYLAFTEKASAGMQHLRALANAGLKAVHLLPTFDIATIDENRANWKTPGDLSKLPRNSDAQQKAVDAVKDADAYNWGYDPYHYMTPEGSYAVNPQSRTKEYRQMVMALNGAGLRVVQDVVFNHTAASGQAERSVLDRVVPGYYQRLNANGGIENSSCCSNTATEHNMMRKLMIDTLVLQAKAYKIDGFRFDLMGHHMVADMQAARQALDALTPEKDGVNGKQIYIYGEGWDFGEVQGNKRGPNAVQGNMYGQGIGTFNDRIRDAVRGGGPFAGAQEQGFATGLVSLPNGQPGDTDKTKLLQLSDLIKVGLSGNLRDYKLVNAQGQTVTGAGVNYGGAPAGYAASPREAINYASAHDNQTLYDAVLLKAPVSATTAQRTRMQNLANSIILLGQGLPFSQAGDDLLRSKSFDTDSYNSGDWFNSIDWSGKQNGLGRGLPPAEKNEGNWKLYGPLLASSALQPTPANIARAADHYREMLRVRYSSTLFRLGTAQDVQNALTFLNVGPAQIPGVVVMKLTGQPNMAKGEAGNPWRNVVVVFNGTGKSVTLSDPKLAGLGLSLHPVLASSTDTVVRQSSYKGNAVTVPGLTTAVFVGQ